jgi:hypothetical protein
VALVVPEVMLVRRVMEEQAPTVVWLIATVEMAETAAIAAPPAREASAARWVAAAAEVILVPAGLMVSLWSGLQAMAGGAVVVLPERRVLLAVRAVPVATAVRKAMGVPAGQGGRAVQVRPVATALRAATGQQVLTAALAELAAGVALVGRFRALLVQAVRAA